MSGGLCERCGEYSAGKIFSVIRIVINAGAISRAVEKTYCVINVGDVAPNLNALVAIGNEVGRQCSLDEEVVGSGLEAFKTDGTFEFSGAEDSQRGIPEVEIGVLQYDF